MSDRIRIDSTKYEDELAKLGLKAIQVNTLLEVGELEAAVDLLTELRQSIIELAEKASNASPMADLSGVGKDKIVQLLGDDQIDEIMNLFSGNPGESDIFVLDE